MAMPSLAHESLVDLFKSRPALAAEILVEALGIALPTYTALIELRRLLASRGLAKEFWQ